MCDTEKVHEYYARTGDTRFEETGDITALPPLLNVELRHDHQEVSQGERLIDVEGSFMQPAFSGCQANSVTCRDRCGRAIYAASMKKGNGRN